MRKLKFRKMGVILPRSRPSDAMGTEARGPACSAPSVSELSPVLEKAEQLISGPNALSSMRSLGEIS